MTIADLIKEHQPKMDEAMQFLDDEFHGIHTGRASGSIVESILVNYYGTKTPLRQLSTITTPGPTQIVITPYDKNSLGDIEEAIRDSELKFNPVNDGKSVRISMPSLTEERRSELAKFIKTKAEQARISIRNTRHEVWDEVQKQVKEKTLSEDDKYVGQEELNKLTEEYNKKIDELVAKKEKEIMTI